MLTISTFGSFNLARRALLAHQLALDTIGHNLANAATPGYSRQRAELVATDHRNGVAVEDVRRLRDRFLDFAALTELGALGKYQAQDALLQRLQAVFTDSPGTGLSSMLDQFFEALQDLSVDPTDQAVRLVVQDRAQRLVATFQGLDARISQISRDVEIEIQDRVTTANALLGEIAELHRQIIAARNGPTPNDLLDRRDRLVAELGQIVGVTPLDRDDGTVQLAMTGTGILLVDGTTTAPLRATLDGGTDTVELTAGAAALPVVPRSGALAALLEARNSPTGPLGQARADLDALAGTIIQEVNLLHASGTGLTGHATLTSVNAVGAPGAPLGAAGLPGPIVDGAFRVIVHDAAGAVVSDIAVAVDPGVTSLEDIRALLDADATLTATIADGTLTLAAAPGHTFTFADDTSGTLAALGVNTFFTGSDARSIALHTVIAGDANQIAAARADGGGLVHPGDGANALALARLRTALTMNDGTATFVDAFGGAVARAGAQARDAAEAAGRQRAAVQLVEGLQQQVAGVSIDEELINLTQSQTAYAAAARYVTVLNEVVATLLEMGR
jgi:flagellar hook-associated protein 1